MSLYKLRSACFVFCGDVLRLAKIFLHTQTHTHDYVNRMCVVVGPGSGEWSTPDHSRHAPPHKPPRGQRTPADENEPPWDAPQYQPRGAPPRRYSMSSFDGATAKGPIPIPPRSRHHDPQPRHHHDNNPPRHHHHDPSPPQQQSQPQPQPQPQPHRRRLLPELPPGAGDRPATLPRKLRSRHQEDPAPQGSLAPAYDNDPTRFHSMPRTRSRSPGGVGRGGRSEPSRVYLGSGPIPTQSPRTRSPTAPDMVPALTRRPATNQPQPPAQGVTRIIPVEMEMDEMPPRHPSPPPTFTLTSGRSSQWSIHTLS